jgi:large subunit ribosomal protein L29
MKSKEVSAMSAAELQGKLDESYKEIFNLRFQRAQGQLKDTNAIRKVRRDIARMKTVLRQRELAAEIQAKAAPAE